MILQWNGKLKTAEDYQKLLSKIIQPTEKYFSGTQSTIELPEHYATSYSENILKIESFARILWGYFFLENDKDTINKLLIMIKNGVDSDNVQYWGKISDYSQLIVETLPIMLFCDRYIQLIKEDAIFYHNIGEWFGSINDVKVSKNNWQCFVILINMLLEHCSLPFSEDKINEAKAAIEDMYLGNGWYSDGITNQRDYYISFAFHYYLLLSTLYSTDKTYVDKVKNRSLKFSKTFISWFSDTGEALPFGRSLTYKFAQSAFWSMLIATDTDAKNNDIYKGLLNRNLYWWLQQNIFDDNGIMTLGYAYHNHTFTEYYNGTGSSYWALKAFAILISEKNNNVFQIEEARFPQIDATLCIPEAKMVVHRYHGYPFAFVAGQSCSNRFGHTECKYEKFVYSPAFPFCISKSYVGMELLACDSNLSISLNGFDYFARHNCVNNNVEKNIITSKWIPIPGIKIYSHIIPGAPDHTRIHCIETNASIEVVDSGYSIEQDNSTYASISNGIAMIYHNKTIGWAQSLIGDGEPIIICTGANTNSVYTNCKIPAIKWSLNPGKYIIGTCFGGDINTSVKFYEFPKYDISLKDNTVVINGRTFRIRESVKRYHIPNMLIRSLKQLKRLLKRLRNSI